MAELNYEAVNNYWRTARPSILGPYMMDGFGFPASAGRFRFRAETRIAERLIRDLNSDGTVLDLGSGIGYWAEHFSEQFAKVVAVEASTQLYDALKQRCASHANVKTIHGDVLSYEPQDCFELVFSGGLLMYLNEGDVVTLLRTLTRHLESGGLIVCRESTVRNGVVTREGEYQAVYRDIATYTRIFNECGLSVVAVKQNTPYVLMQMGCEFVSKWKTLVPKPLRMIPFVGHLVYWALRIGYPWITHIPRVFGLNYPELTNHFFVLRPDSAVSTDSQTGSAVT
ncbi:MAG TPA: class I SAM-dependent methyltransferase [Planctomycetes bacterium]|nr:class I SAM-dependent methyltransferase [Fuerstiella sp.]HIK90993.1 class I SAM-dependent methyltransferase [Planctomycetota bacterium]